MFQKIEQWLFQRKYSATYRKEAYAYALEAGVIKQDIKELNDALQTNLKLVDEKQALMDKIEQDLKTLEGDAYTESRKEWEALRVEIPSMKERNDDLQKKVLPGKYRELGSKMQSTQNSIYKAKQIKNVRL